MNRIHLQLIKENTTPPISQLHEIITCVPYSTGWISEKFPVYPIIINLYLANPPFNKISVSLYQKYLPSKMRLYGSANAEQYFKIWEISQFEGFNVDNLTINFEESHHYKYMRVIFDEPLNQQSNICRQVGLRCIQVTNITIYGSQYACSMASALKYDPYLFRLLEILQYKALLLKNKDRQASAKHYKSIQKLFHRLKVGKQNLSHLSQPIRQQLMKEMKQIMNQPLDSFQGQQIKYDREGIKNQVKTLEEELASFYIYRLNSLHKDVTDYFQKYWNVEIKEQYLRLLSSPEREDHGKALSMFWAEIKKLGQYPLNIEQATVMFFNYFLEYIHDPLKITAIKIMCLFFRAPNLSFKIYHVYQRVLFNLYNQLIDPENQELFNTSIKCIYTLFQKVPDNLFIQALLNPEHSVKFSMRLTKLEILEKITFRNVTIENKQPVFDFLLDILLQKNLTLEQKNKAYNIIAYLASLMGKQPVMLRFQKLNAMILMPMEKIIDKKLQKIKMPKKGEEVPSCDHCGITREAFRDPNVLDLHCFKECKYLAPCKYCAQIVEIPEIFKHYIHECKERNMFKQCENCNETIIKDSQKQHLKVCTRMLATKCPLCFQTLEGKLKLKEHILKEGCPNNNR